MCLAIPGKIIEINQSNPDDFNHKAKVSFGGLIREVSIIYTPEAQVGDYVLVHAGFAISKLKEEEALEVFKYLDETIKKMETN